MNTSATTLFCEGTQDSLDFKMLNMLLSSGTGRTVLVPAGSKTGIKAFMKGYSAQPRVMSEDTYRAYRDRDYDYMIPEFPCLIRDLKDERILISYRTTIENYLLSPENLFVFAREKEDKKLKSRIKSLEESENIFAEAIADLRHYTAARWAFSTIQRNYRNYFQTGVTWRHESGILPKDLSNSACKNILMEIADEIKVASANIKPRIFEEEYETYLYQFNVDFISDVKKCLIWFNGKDLAKMLYNKLEGNSFFHARKGGFYDFVFTQQLFKVDDFPDLIELREILTNNRK